MIDERFARTELIFGEAGMQRLQSARVAVFRRRRRRRTFGAALARAGVGHITVIDDDVVSVSNINRQAVAMDSTVGRPKVEVIAEQVKDINPACEVVPLRMFYTPESAETLDLAQFDAIADCIDTVKAKVTLVCRRRRRAYTPSARWGRATSSTRRGFRWRISPKPASARSAA